MGREMAGHYCGLALLANDNSKLGEMNEDGVELIHCFD